MKTSFLISLILCSILFTSVHSALFFTDVEVGKGSLESFTVTTDVPGNIGFTGSWYIDLRFRLSR